MICASDKTATIFIVKLFKDTHRNVLSCSQYILILLSQVLISQSSTHLKAC